MSDRINLCFRPESQNMHECSFCSWDQQSKCRFAEKKTHKNECLYLSFGKFCQRWEAADECNRSNPASEDELPNFKGVLDRSMVEKFHKKRGRSMVDVLEEIQREALAKLPSDTIELPIKLATFEFNGLEDE